ncbi:MAG: hypothetical protein HQL40_14935 [Alphaproteobacteria bacterium]|nr:hypothetical protein [Alphaproteobacteria bacterium]
MIYVLAIAAVALGAAAVAIRLPLHRHLAGMIMAAAMLYFGAVVPGALSLLTGPVVAGATVALGVAALALAPRLGPARPVQGAVPTVALAVTAGAIPLLASKGTDGALRILEALTWEVPVLNWDVVSYHMPGLVEFAQNQTLWSFEGPFQSYTFGFEIIGALPFMLEGKVFGVVLTTLLSLILAVVAAASLGDLFAGRGANIVARLLVAGGAALLVVLMLAEETAQLGKNDTFAAAAVVAALVFSISALHPDNDRTRQLSGLLLSALALALAGAAKPTMWGFGPIWGLGALWLVWRRAKRRDAAWLLPMMAVTFALGGFFLLRNLAAFGLLTGTLQHIPNKQLALNLTAEARALLINDQWLLWMLGGCLILIGFAKWAPREEREQWLLVLGWYASAVAVFGLTPYSLWFGSIQWRFGMVAHIIAMTAVMAAAARMGAALWTRFAQMAAVPRLLERATMLGVAAGPMRFVPTVPVRPRISGRAAALGLAAAWTALATAPLLLARPSPPGLPGYDETHGIPTGIYRWVQSRSGAERIYAAGLRPLGLYGRDWNNRLFYDLHSAPLLRDPDWARKRLEAVRQDFGPTLVILATDPHVHEGNDTKAKPLVDWLAKQPCTDEIYHDAIATAFAVTPDCHQPWNNGERARERPKPLG